MHTQIHQGKSKNRPQPARPITRKQLLTMAGMPLVLVAMLALDQAFADGFIVPAKTWIKPAAFAQETTESIRSFYVEPDINGNINGQISAIEIEGTSPIEQELEVSLIKNGDEIRTARTDMGRFILNDVPDDETYTFIASGQNGFAAYAIRVNPRKLRLNKNSRQASPKNQYVRVPKLRKPSFKFQDSFEIDAAAIPPTFNTLEQIVGNRIPSDVELTNSGIRSQAPPTDKTLEIAARFTYELNPNGTFSGKVILPHGNDENREFSDLNIYLLQNDMQVSGGQTSVSKDGKFSVGNEDSKVEPGIYALVAAGRDGFAAVSVKLVAPGTTDELTTNPEENEAYTKVEVEKTEAEFYVPLITDPRDLMYVRDAIRQINRDRDAVGIADSAPLDTGFGQFADAGGFIGGETGFGAPQGGPTAAPRGFGSFGRLTTFDRRRLFRRALLTGAVIALSVNDGDSPADESPSTVSQ